MCVYLVAIYAMRSVYIYIRQCISYTLQFDNHLFCHVDFSKHVPVRTAKLSVPPGPGSYFSQYLSTDQQATGQSIAFVRSLSGAPVTTTF